MISRHQESKEFRRNDAKLLMYRAVLQQISNYSLIELKIVSCNEFKSGKLQCCLACHGLSNGLVTHALIDGYMSARLLRLIQQLYDHDIWKLLYTTLFWAS